MCHKKRILRIDKADNVAVALEDIYSGEVVTDGNVSFMTHEAIPANHKVAVTDLMVGDAVIKYGAPIGVITKETVKGALVHTHNLIMGPFFRQDRRGGSEANSGFWGYQRKNGQVGVRNHVVVIPTVGCAASLAEKIADNVVGLIPLLHTESCNNKENGHYLTRIITNLGKNPNHYAVILVGIGCEEDDALKIADEIRRTTQKPVSVFLTQKHGGYQRVFEKASKIAGRYCKAATQEKRVWCSIEDLVLGTECGGSDALSGITANPVIGVVSDWVVKNGGTSILSEVDELKGCEDILSERAMTPVIARKIRDVIGAWPEQKYDESYLSGGITNVLEKSLGCLRKGGTEQISAVIGYGEEISQRRGLVLMDGTGFDIESVCGLAAAGAQVIIFSSGHGNPLGFPTIPVIKVCSNPSTYEAVGGINGDMDINAGEIITDGCNVSEMGARCIEVVTDVICGKETVAEKNNYGGMLGIYRRTLPF